MVQHHNTSGFQHSLKNSPPATYWTPLILGCWFVANLFLKHVDNKSNQWSFETQHGLIFNLHVFCTTSLQVLFGIPLTTEPSTSYSIHFFTQSHTHTHTCTHACTHTRTHTHTHTHTCGPVDGTSMNKECEGDRQVWAVRFLTWEDVAPHRPMSPTKHTQNPMARRIRDDWWVWPSHGECRGSAWRG